MNAFKYGRYARSQTFREGGPNFVLREGDSKNLLSEGEKLFHLRRGYGGGFFSQKMRNKNKEDITFSKHFFRKNILISWKKIFIFWKEILKFFHVFWQLREGVALESFKSFILGALLKASGRGTY